MVLARGAVYISATEQRGQVWECGEGARDAATVSRDVAGLMRQEAGTGTDLFPAHRKIYSYSYSYSYSIFIFHFTDDNDTVMIG